MGERKRCLPPGWKDGSGRGTGRLRGRTPGPASSWWMKELIKPAASLPLCKFRLATWHLSRMWGSVLKRKTESEVVPPKHCSIQCSLHGKGQHTATCSQCHYRRPDKRQPALLPPGSAPAFLCGRSLGGPLLCLRTDPHIPERYQVARWNLQRGWLAAGFMSCSGGTLPAPVCTPARPFHLPRVPSHPRGQLHPSLQPISVATAAGCPSHRPHEAEPSLALMLPAPPSLSCLHPGANPPTAWPSPAAMSPAHVHAHTHNVEPALGCLQSARMVE